MDCRLLTPDEKQARQNEINVRVTGMLKQVDTLQRLVQMFKDELSEPIPDVNRYGYIALLEHVSKLLVAEYRDLIPINLSINPFDSGGYHGGDYYHYDYGRRAHELGVKLGPLNPRDNPNYNFSLENKYHDSHHARTSMALCMTAKLT